MEASRSPMAKSNSPTARVRSPGLQGRRALTLVGVRPGAGVGMGVGMVVGTGRSGGVAAGGGHRLPLETTFRAQIPSGARAAPRRPERRQGRRGRVTAAAVHPAQGRM